MQNVRKAVQRKLFRKRIGFEKKKGGGNRPLRMTCRHLVQKDYAWHDEVSPSPRVIFHWFAFLWRYHDHLAKRYERQAGQLDVLQGERDPDERAGKDQCPEEVPERQPPAAQDDPQDVTDEDSDIHGAIGPVYQFTAERPERECANAEGSNSEGETDDRDGQRKGRDPPPEAHEEPAEDEPNDIAQ